MFPQANHHHHQETEPNVLNLWGSPFNEAKTKPHLNKENEKCHYNFRVFFIPSLLGFDLMAEPLTLRA